MKYTMNLAIGIAVSLGLLRSDTVGQEEDSVRVDERHADTTVRRGWAVVDEAQARERAVSLLGVDNSVLSAGEIRVVELSTDNTAFLSEAITDRPLWHLHLEDWKIDFESTRAKVDIHPRALDIYVDPNSGQLVKVLSNRRGVQPSALSLPTAEFAEQGLQRIGHQYHGFPAEPPGITFLEALNVGRRDGIGDPNKSELIVGQYLLWSKLGAEPRPVWIITLWGIPPIPTPSSGVPLEARNHIREIVDAATGQWLQAGTAPQPGPTKERLHKGTASVP